MLNNLLLKNVRVVTPENIIEKKLFYCYEGKIVDESGIGTGIKWNECNAEGKLLIPGLVDTHVHGAGGADTMDATVKGMNTIARTLAEFGTTSFLPTTMSATVDGVCKAIFNVQECMKKHKENVFAGAEILGVHMEGPLISVKYKGAQAAETIVLETEESDVKFLQKVFAECGSDNVHIITFAIERLAAQNTIEMCKKNNIIVSVGHTCAGYEQMKQAIEWGVSSVTHSFNAMAGIHHREPGLLTAALLSDGVNMEIIADCVHVHPAVIDVVLRCKHHQHVSCISDGTRAVGMAEGEYDLGGQKTFVKDGVAKLADGTIAGSAFPLMQGLKTLINVLGLSLPKALMYVALNPANKIGMGHRIGSLESGKDADLVLVNEALDVNKVWLKGVELC